MGSAVNDAPHQDHPVDRQDQVPGPAAGAVQPPAGESAAAPALAGTVDLACLLNRLVLKLSEPTAKPEKGILDWLNCPFVVTVIGGVLIALLTVVWQGCGSYLTAKRTTALERYGQKQRVLSSFANEYPAALGRLYHTKKKWLAAAALGPHNPNREKAERAATRPLAQEYSDARKAFDEVNEKYSGNKLGSALCAEAKATFDSKEVNEALQELINTSNQLFNLKDLQDIKKLEDQVEALHLRANDQYEAVVVKMGEELRNTKMN
jgi:hypothetical protein